MGKTVLMQGRTKRPLPNSGGRVELNTAAAEAESVTAEPMEATTL